MQLRINYQYQYYYLQSNTQRLQGIDYLKYDNCNNDGTKPTVR